MMGSLGKRVILLASMCIGDSSIESLSRALLLLVYCFYREISHCWASPSAMVPEEDIQQGLGGVEIQAALSFQSLYLAPDMILKLRVLLVLLSSNFPRKLSSTVDPELPNSMPEGGFFSSQHRRKN